MWFAAAITRFTTCGAPGGGIARPSIKLEPQFSLLRTAAGGVGMHPVPQGAPAAAAGATGVAAKAPAKHRAATKLFAIRLTVRVSLREPPNEKGRPEGRPFHDSAVRPPGRSLSPSACSRG
jgi:hypothetical protein